jgi:hypothetical protein
LRQQLLSSGLCCCSWVAFIHFSPAAEYACIAFLLQLEPVYCNYQCRCWALARMRWVWRTTMSLGSFMHIFCFRSRCLCCLLHGYLFAAGAGVCC